MTQQQKNKKTLITLVIVVVAMFGFGFAMVPLYQVFCDIAGINGKINTSNRQKISSTIDKSRFIKIEFLAVNNESLPWSFYPMTQVIKVHPGEVTRISYYAKNNSNHTMTVQAVPSVSPGMAATHIKKTECFCFTSQTLKAGAKMAMPVLFHVDSELPKNIHTISMSYTLFDKDKQAKKSSQKGKTNHDRSHL